MANVQIRSFGGLNTDTHVQDLRNGDYPDAKNIDHISAVTGESVAVTPRMGNEYAFELGEVTAQDKRYLITFPDAEPSGGYTLQVNRADQVNPLFESFYVPLYDHDPEIPPGDQAATTIQNAFASAFYPVDVVHASTIYPTLAGTRTLLITPQADSPALRYYDYFIQSIGENVLKVDVIQESISNSRTGILEVIGSKDLLGDLFIISSTRREESFELKIINISIIVFSGISTLFVTPDATDQVLVDEQEVYITGVQGIPEANGIFIIKIYPDPQTGENLILLFNSFANPSQTYVPGTGTITFNKFGIGEIGVAQKDLSKNTWKYTRLLRSKELNLFTFHQCDVQGEKSFNRKSIYYTDNNDVPRNFYYKIDTEYYVDGGLRILYPESGYYDYGSIADQTNHILGQPILDIDFVSQAQGGGSLDVGNHVYFARGVLADGSYTDWSLPSRYIPVYSASTLDNPKDIIGNIEGSQSNKANQIRISNIQGDVYSFIEVACINYVNIGYDATNYGIFTRRQVSRDITELVITHNGREEGQTFNQNELSVQTETYTKAKNNAIIDNRYVLSNLQTPGDNLKSLFDKVKYSIKTKQISKPRYRISQKFGGHQDPYNVFYFSGYMMNETYRIGARVRYKNGYISPVYTLFDATIDNEQTSIDEKRLSGLSNYDLNALGTTGLDPATGFPYPENVNNIVPYIEIQGPDLSIETIDGVPASLLLDRIEYFRAEVTKPTIIGSGFAVMHVKCLTNATNSPPQYIRQASPTSRATITLSNPLPLIAQDTSSPIGSNPMISYEFPFVVSNDASQNSPATLSDIPSTLNYYDTRFTINDGPRLGTNFGYKWNDLYASVYFIDAFLNGNNESINIGTGDSIINTGQYSVFNTEASGDSPSNRFAELLSLNTQKEEVVIDNSLYVPIGDPLKISTDYVTKLMGNTPSTTSNPSFSIPDATEIPATGTSNTWSLFGRYSTTEIYNNNTNIAGVDSSGNPNAFNGNTGAQVEFCAWWAIYVEPGTGIVASAYGETGVTFTAPTNDVIWNNYSITLSKILPSITGTAFYTFQLTAAVTDSANKRYSFNPGYVVKLQNTLSSYAGANYKGRDTGIRAIQVKSNLSGTNQYSEVGLDNFVYTGSFQKSAATRTVELFGGDTLTTQIYVKTIIQNENPTAPITGGFTTGILLTTQTKSNPYLIYKVDGEDLFPVTFNANNIYDNLYNWLSKRVFDTYNYNYGYSINNLGVGYKAGVTDEQTRKLPTRVIYSDNKPQNARSDFYRRFGVVSYTDLDASFGEINSMKNVNGELFTLQVNKYQKQFFNSRGTLQVSDGSQVVLGDAGVFSRPGITVTSYGCTDKWSSFLGKSAGGDDILYWYDSINKKFMRFGADGAVPISDRANIRTLARDGFKWVVDYQTPADNYGIHGIWNQRLNEAAWTCRAYRKPDVIWQPLTAIAEGQLVITYDTNQTYGFERFPIIYICIQSSEFNNALNPGEDPGWEEYYTPVAFDDIEYYSLRTIVWSEVKNRFIISDETPHPRIYLQYKDTLLSPSPAANANVLYEHNEGKYLEWYITSRLGQREDGYIDIVFNIDPNTTKHFISLICNTEFMPYKVELFTKNHSTIINPVEFLEQLDQYVAPIPNDLDSNGSTGSDNSFLYGQWVKVRFHYESGKFQRLTNMILKFNPMARLWNS
jgi:hypothetical protein